MTSVPKNVYLDKLDNIVNKYNNMYHSTIKMKPVDVEFFVIKKVKNTVPSKYIIRDSKGEEIVGTFYEKELKKTNQKEFRVENVIKRKSDKSYVKWKGYDSSFNSWIDKKDIL